MADPVKPRPVTEGVTGPAPTADEWRAAMGYFPTGVTIVTAWRDATPVGTTASSFCSVSLTPPLLLVCLDLANPALAPIERSGRFGVNILSAECRDLALRFGRNPQVDPFAAIAHRARAGGAPHLEAATVFIDCVVEAAHAAGDHKIVVGRGAHIDHNSTAPPLLYHKGAFPNLA
jgi:3-hydroxy-9,10-secoandrosta-1,3,5(10)-triene-9,17-dione monooxygenase reductase component